MRPDFKGLFYKKLARAAVKCLKKRPERAQKVENMKKSYGLLKIINFFLNLFFVLFNSTMTFQCTQYGKVI